MFPRGYGASVKHIPFKDKLAGQEAQASRLKAESGEAVIALTCLSWNLTVCQKWGQSPDFRGAVNR